MPCRRAGRFEVDDVRRRLREADLVILAANWKDWQVPYLPETLDSLRRMGAKRVVVVGRRSFGRVAPLGYLGMTDESKRRLQNPVDEHQPAVNAFMRDHLPTAVFVDLQSLVCGNDATCPVFTDDLRLIAFDGEHLTPDGARIVGKRIFGHPPLAAWRGPAAMVAPASM